MIRLPSLSARHSGRTSLAANVLGRAWALVANVVMFPIYLRLLGQESFGIVAVLTSVTAIVALFDFGLTPVFSRELNHQGRERQSRLDLMRTAETVFFAIVLLVILAAMVVPDATLGALVRASDTSSPAPIATALRWVFFVAAAQLMFNLYISAMSGIEAQVQSNMLSIGTNLVRSVGVVVPLLVHPTVEVFLVWQFLVTLLGLLAARVVLRRLLSGSAGTSKATFSLRELRSHLPATAASFLLASAATLNMNLDKLFVSKIEGLASIAEYSIAATFAQLIFVASVPISMTVTPRMVRAVTASDTAAFNRLLTLTRSLIGIVSSVLLVISIWHGPAMIEYWSSGTVSAEQLEAYIFWLFLGSSCLAVSAIYHCVAVAHLDFAFGRPYVLSIILTIPAYWLAIDAFGLRGAAIAWGGTQLCIVVAYMLWVTRRWLHGDLWRTAPWMSVGIGASAGAASCLLLGPLAQDARGVGPLLLVIAGELVVAAVLATAMLAAVHRRLAPDDALASRAYTWFWTLLRRQDIP